MIDIRCKFLADLIADLGKIFIGAGAIKQVFSEVPDWIEISIALIISLALFIIAFFIHPKNEG